MGFRFDATKLIQGLESYEARAMLAVEMYGRTAAVRLEGYAKKDAPWTDRTGAARNRLTGSTERQVTGVRVMLSHGVDYGMWLELANEKRYAIVAPTINLRSPEIFKGLERLLDRL